MSGALKPTPRPPGTLYHRKIEIDGKETYVEAYVKGDALFFSIGKHQLEYSASALLKHNLIEIGEDALRKYEAFLHPELATENKNDNEMPNPQDEIAA